MLLKIPFYRFAYRMNTQKIMQQKEFIYSLLFSLPNLRKRIDDELKLLDGLMCDDSSYSFYKISNKAYRLSNS